MAPRELVAESAATADEIEQALTEALEKRGVFVLRDDRGGIYLVPSEKIAYIELGRPEARRIGFGA